MKYALYGDPVELGEYSEHEYLRDEVVPDIQRTCLSDNLPIDSHRRYEDLERMRHSLNLASVNPKNFADGVETTKQNMGGFAEFGNTHILHLEERLLDKAMERFHTPFRTSTGAYAIVPETLDLEALAAAQAAQSPAQPGASGAESE